ncbi:MAG: hypothetical protein WBW27_21440 [Pseudolabrys sp.]
MTHGQSQLLAQQTLTQINAGMWQCRFHASEALTQMSPQLEKALIWGGMTALAVALLLIAAFLVD